MAKPVDVRARLGAATANVSHRDAVQHICTVVPELVDGIDEAGVCLIAGPNLRTVLASTSPFAERLDWLQFELGEGPCLLASETGRVEP